MHASVRDSVCVFIWTSRFIVLTGNLSHNMATLTWTDIYQLGKTGVFYTMSLSIRNNHNGTFSSEIDTLEHQTEVKVCTINHQADDGGYACCNADVKSVIRSGLSTRKKCVRVLYCFSSCHLIFKHWRMRFPPAWRGLSFCADILKYGRNVWRNVWR